MVVLDDLNTGNSGVEPTFGNEEQPTEVVEAIAEQNKLIQDLLPGVEWLEEKLDEALGKIKDFDTYMESLGANPKAQDIQVEYRARQMFSTLVENLKQELSNSKTTAQNVAEVNRG